MARIITPGSMRPDNSGWGRSRPWFLTELIGRYGVRAILALLVAAVFAFAPLAVLYWFNNVRLQSVVTVTVESSQRAVVKPAQPHDEQEREEPGETALLQIRCLVPTVDGWQELLGDGDPARPSSPFGGLRYVRQERVYLRRAGSSVIPFGLLGPPPASVWLPAGNYEILVVHEAPNDERRIDAPGRSFPLLSVFADCVLESRRKTVVEVQLPHYYSGNPDVLLGIGDGIESVDRKPTADELASLIADCESLTAIPTPAGYVVNVPEPQIHHREGHRDCAQDYHDRIAVPREWTRSQLATLRNWLPRDAGPAQDRLTALIDQLGWREFLEGWFCYAAAGISGLVFTRWGTIALLEPWRRGDAWNESLGLIVKIFVFSIGVWFLFQVLFGSSSCHGPVQFRMH